MSTHNKKKLATKTASIFANRPTAGGARVQGHARRNGSQRLITDQYLFSTVNDSFRKVFKTAQEVRRNKKRRESFTQKQPPVAFCVRPNGRSIPGVLKISRVGNKNILLGTREELLTFILGFYDAVAAFVLKLRSSTHRSRALGVYRSPFHC